ncbi:MAG: TRAP transporter small permease subunit [Deltaproteobacteria bacterium]|nr:TRAP transporter small permease subunit [Deltaproteobacteria bacterium]
MKKILKAIDTINDFTGKTVKWVVVLIMVTITTEVALRYIFSSPTSVLPELMMMFGAALYTLGWGYVHRLRRHVRVDIFYLSLPTRWQAGIDVVATLIWLLPMVASLVFVSVGWAYRSFVVEERSSFSYWFPLLWPIRTVVSVGMILLALQALAQFYRDLYLLVRNKAYD